MRHQSRICLWDTECDMTEGTEETITDPEEELGQEALDNYFDMRQGKADRCTDW